MFDILHRPQTRRRGKEAVNALKVALEVIEKALDGIPMPGPKLAVGTLLSIIIALEVSPLLALDAKVYSVRRIRNLQETLKQL